MAKFRGRYDFSIDDKGRINIPSKFRKLLSPEAEDTFVISRGPDNCLWAYPKNEWEKFEDTLETMPMSKDSNRVQRAIQNTLSDSSLDRQGRISLTGRQMEIAGIDKLVTIIGRGHYLEIWDTQRFEGFAEEVDFDDIFYKTIGSSKSRD